MSTRVSYTVCLCGYPMWAQRIYSMYVEPANMCVCAYVHVLCVYMYVCMYDCQFVAVCIWAAVEPVLHMYII